MTGPGTGLSTLSGRLLEGRYRVGAIIARGGMSTVYRGIDTRLERPVAIKVMHAAYATDPAFVERFHREARAAAGVRSPGVVAVYDQGDDLSGDGRVLFLVMELIDGGTLRDLLRAGPLDVDVALSVLEPVLAALAAAHAAGLVHRDVKPENVLISGRGEVKVADFGLVRSSDTVSHATGNVILGTVAYLSPEQVATGASDTRSDVYSAGLVAYEMLTGHPPFDGDNAITVAYQHVHTDVPPVTDEAPNVPLELDELILAATRRDPDRRPRDAAAFLAAVVALRARLRIPRVPVPSPKTRDPAATRGPASAATDPVGRGRTRLLPTTGTPAAPPRRTRPGNRPAADLTDARERTRRRRRRWLLAGLVILLLAVAAAVGGWWLGSGRWATMPATVGVDRQHAVQLVQAAGLGATVTTAPDDTVAVGDVARTEPTAGVRRPRGSAVTLVVSTGLPTVPDVPPGTTVAAASALVTAARLDPQTDSAQDAYDQTVAAGLVLATKPAAGTRMRIDSTVLLVRSKGRAPVAVPEVAGKSLEDAQNALLAHGFTLGPEQRRFDADVPAGDVVGSVPATGAMAPYGSAVALVRADSLTVPDLRGRTADDARNQLRQLGFTPVDGSTTFDGGVPGGSVVSTDPTAGARVDPAAATVALVTSTAIAVPPLVGLTRDQARDTLTGLGLQAAYSSFLTFGGSQIYAQDPHAGTLVAPGSSVTLSLLP